MNRFRTACGLATIVIVILLMTAKSHACEADNRNTVEERLACLEQRAHDRANERQNQEMREDPWWQKRNKQ